MSFIILYEKNYFDRFINQIRKPYILNIFRRLIRVRHIYTDNRNKLI